jgi:hypothetical protein
MVYFTKAYTLPFSRREPIPLILAVDTLARTIGYIEEGF